MVVWWHLPVLLATGVAAGFVDSIAGGGGLITVPVLLNLGLPPQVALGTNKLQATFGSGSATYGYGRAGLIAWAECPLGVLCSFAGAVAGSLTVQQLEPGLLRRLIPWLLVAVAIYTLVRPRFGQTQEPPRLPPLLFYGLAGSVIGFYDGFFGPGTGSFWAMAFVLGLGFDLTRATAHTKLMNFASNVGSLVVFLLAGQAVWAYGLAMGLGQCVGARLGAGAVVRRGAGFIRPIFVAVALAITARLLYQQWVSR